MNVVYVPSAIRKPFTFIDISVVQAMRRMGFQVIVIRPGETLEQKWNHLKRETRPDFLLAMLGERLTEANLQLIKTLPLPKAVWYTDDPYAIDRSVQTCHAFDWVFTNESEAVPVYQKKCSARVIHLPLAAPHLTYQSLKTVPPSYRSQIVLVGSAFQNRLAVMEKISPVLKRFQTRLVGPGWDRLSSKSFFRLRKGWVKPSEVCRYYNGARIVLNIHRSFDDPYLKQNRLRVRAATPNNRLFEIAACSAFQIIDFRQDLQKYYVSDEEMVSFRSLEELKEKIRFYLPREQLRRKIAARAYQRTIREHLYEHRIQKMVQLIQSGGIKNQI
ncbi:CgeB family protein [Lihuaxuella thermophila]|uniref:Spore maturation protein CgeB n=1 Tax=Lihuaxuella thermophila TaxID=1173111 RepID=A0A1H8GET4_9BACL|nr:glycosyltransferase [Lihuaxuella thermophila]SEN41987.1 spore maturation protein CgeB [Lihuaxuella thermophila]